VASESAGTFRLEIALVGICTAVWAVALLGLWGLLPTAGLLDLDLYRLYSVAAVLGWLSGNLFVLRRRSLGPDHRRRLLLTYLLGPPAFVYLLRALASRAVQEAAPIVPLYCFLVYGMLFLVPVTLPARRRPFT
jgi:hypothetical protein